MIPRDYITEWRAHAPWVQDIQVEQDLVICRALIAIFSDPLLKDALAFRGGTSFISNPLPAILRILISYRSKPGPQARSCKPCVPFSILGWACHAGNRRKAASPSSIQSSRRTPYLHSNRPAERSCSEHSSQTVSSPACSSTCESDCRSDR
jgi:hypothetical protein